MHFCEDFFHVDDCEKPISKPISRLNWNIHCKNNGNSSSTVFSLNIDLLRYDRLQCLLCPTFAKVLLWLCKVQGIAHIKHPWYFRSSQHFSKNERLYWIAAMSKGFNIIMVGCSHFSLLRRYALYAIRSWHLSCSPTCKCSLMSRAKNGLISLWENFALLRVRNQNISNFKGIWVLMFIISSFHNL